MAGEDLKEVSSKVYGDPVNHPKHYEGSTSMECIDVMTIIFGKKYVSAFCLCNAFKYLWRFRHKNGIEDLNKAEWYISYYETKLMKDRFTKFNVISGKLKKLLEKYKEEYK